ncbi:hypothetical protein BJY04DRAFT_186242 [Aspergillus karnatakaensis]|uniref:uncharacterized protein n=1 Tax=Aspergillus karnatakaensis TaxID=1810916 RepID=UPI003CCE0DC9
MARPTTPKQLSRLILYAVIGAAVLALIYWSPIAFTSEALAVSEAPPAPSIQAVTDDIKNDTLGVQAIFAINLPSRVDKRDNIMLGASVSGFQIEILDATTPDQIDPKTYPYNWNHAIHRPIEYAARRSHLNAMQRIIKDHLASAIIMEDDADWDVTLKTQLQSFALSVRTLQSQAPVTNPEADTDADTAAAGNPNPDPNSNSPYGNNWDILWLGHCGIECHPPSTTPYTLTPNDPTVPPPDHFLPYWRDEPPHSRPPTARMTCAITDGVCSLVYAVSLRGAQRILAALSVNPSGLAEQIDIGAQFDVSLGRMCGAGYLRCYAPYPALTGGYKAAGSAAKGSDINGPDVEGEDGDVTEGETEGEGVVVQEPFSHGVMYSTMLNIKRILAGEETVLATWDDVPVREIRPGDVGVIEGYVQAPIPPGSQE